MPEVRESETAASPPPAAELTVTSPAKGAEERPADTVTAATSGDVPTAAAVVTAPSLLAFPTLRPPDMEPAEALRFFLQEGGPIALAQVVYASFQAVTIAFIGQRLGTAEQAGAAMGVSLFNITGTAVLWGFLAALDTLCSQAYGRDPTGRQMVAVLHRGTWLGLALCVPLVVLYLCAPFITIAVFGEELGAPAGEFLRYSPLYLLLNTLAY